VGGHWNTEAVQTGLGRTLVTHLRPLEQLPGAGPGRDRGWPATIPSRGPGRLSQGRPTECPCGLAVATGAVEPTLGRRALLVEQEALQGAISG